MLRRITIQNIFVVSLLVLMVGLLVTAVSPVSAATTWRINWSVPEDNHWSKGLRYWADLVEKRSKGELKIQIFYSDALGDQKSSLEQLRVGSGTIDGCFAIEVFSYWVPEINVFAVMYLFKDEGHLLRVVNGPIGEELKELLRTKGGWRPVSAFIRPPRNVTSNFPINKVADLKGVKIRTPESAAMVAGFTALGAKVTPLPFPEVYMACKTGVIDAQENPLDMIYDMKFHEVQKYIAITEHIRNVIFLVVSEKRFQALPADLQKIIIEAGKEAQEYHKDLFHKEFPKYETLLKNAGIKFTYPNQSEFAAAVAPSYEKLDPTIRKLMERIREVK